MILAVLAMLASAVEQPPTQPAGYWTFSAESGDEPNQLNYYPRDDYHAEIYLRCKRGSGLVSVDFSVDTYDELKTLRVGDVALALPPSYGDDPHWNTDLASIVVPTEHRIWFEFERGGTLIVDGESFPVSTDTDRAHARSFVRACNRQEDFRSPDEQGTWLTVLSTYPATISGLRSAREHLGRIEDTNECVEIWRIASSGEYAVTINGLTTPMRTSEAAATARREGSPGAMNARAEDWTKIRGCL